MLLEFDTPRFRRRVLFVERLRITFRLAICEKLINGHGRNNNKEIIDPNIEELLFLLL